MEKETMRALMRVQVAVWLPGRCMVCLRDYESVDDWIERNPRAGPGFSNGNEDERFIDDKCYEGPAVEES